MKIAISTLLLLNIIGLAHAAPHAFNINVTVQNNSNDDYMPDNPTITNCQPGSCTINSFLIAPRQQTQNKAFSVTRVTEDIGANAPGGTFTYQARSNQNQQCVYTFGSNGVSLNTLTSTAKCDPQIVNNPSYFAGVLVGWQSTIVIN